MWNGFAEASSLEVASSASSAVISGSAVIVRRLVQVRAPGGTSPVGSRVVRVALASDHSDRDADRTGERLSAFQKPTPRGQLLVVRRAPGWQRIPGVHRERHSPVELVREPLQFVGDGAVDECGHDLYWPASSSSAGSRSLPAS